MFGKQESQLTKVVLVDAGIAPSAVAKVLEDAMYITITDPTALQEATPIVLFRQLDRSKAEALLLRLQLAGADVDLETPRPRVQGFRLHRAA